MSRLTVLITFILVSGFCTVFGQEKEQLRSEIKRKVQAFAQLPICEKIRVYDSLFSCMDNFDPKEMNFYDSTLNYPFQLLNIMERITGAEGRISRQIGHYSKNDNKYGFYYWECDLDKEIYLWKKKYGCSGAVSLCQTNDSILRIIDSECIGNFEDTSGIATLYVQLLTNSFMFDSLNKTPYTENLFRMYSGELCFLKNSLVPEIAQIYFAGDKTLSKCSYYKISIAWSISKRPEIKSQPDTEIEKLFTGGLVRKSKLVGKSRFQYSFRLLDYEQIDKKDIPLSLIR